MIERFVIREVGTGRYIGERWEFLVGDEERARLYKSRRAAACSMTRKRLNKADYEIVPVTFTFDKKDKWKVPNLNGVAPMDFHTVVEYMHNVVQVDITGNYRGHFQMSFNILDIFFDDNRFLSGMPNGSTFIISEKTFEGEEGHYLMVGNEILRQFGFDEEGRRIAAFVVDWWDDDHNFVAGY
jgi:hypothetical protein